MTGDAAFFKITSQVMVIHPSILLMVQKSKISGTGSIKLTKDLYLDSVLHVPNLDCNLLSISKLARDLQCVAKFYPNSCVFQDLKSGKMIGSAELCSGLYLSMWPILKPSLSSKLCTVSEYVRVFQFCVKF
ncbi:hypothetical protein CK203_079530 [Vitis vinifera]|uniref:Retrovirus-related Pol polyprotein from transposon TNT 1-94-like beta-barrel domain-containing protein n=1 Tax=Vitis vinifera TaxID=29760 RepID=A0A438CP05_VITVI|nr:hypothetical protein CK203_079530 [Vitis vinifera]